MEIVKGMLRGNSQRFRERQRVPKACLKRADQSKKPACGLHCEYNRVYAKTQYSVNATSNELNCGSSSADLACC